MTVGEWEEWAEEHRLAGEPLRITPDEYASLVRLRMANDPLDAAGYTSHIFGTPLIVEGVQ